EGAKVAGEWGESGSAGRGQVVEVRLVECLRLADELLETGDAEGVGTFDESRGLEEQGLGRQFPVTCLTGGPAQLDSNLQALRLVSRQPDGVMAGEQGGGEGGGVVEAPGQFDGLGGQVGCR